MIVIILLTGCVSDIQEELPLPDMQDDVKTQEEVPSRSIRILFGIGGSYSPSTHIEFIAPNAFRIVTLTHPYLGAWWNVNRHIDISTFDTVSLDDFVYMSPMIEFVIADLHNLIVTEDELIELSPEQFNDVMILIDNIAENNADRIFEIAPIEGFVPYVWAIIDGNMYWTVWDIGFSPQFRRAIQHYFNDDLIALVFSLVELSPITIADGFFGL
jgi:hypothetical protein